MKFPLYVKISAGIVGVGLIAFGVSSCSSSSSSSGCPSSVTSWAHSGGITDLDNLATALDNVSPTATVIDQAQLSAIDNALAAAAHNPAPSDIGGSYNDAIAAYQAGDAAYASGDTHTFISQYTTGNQDIKSFESALNTAGCK